MMRSNRVSFIPGHRLASPPPSVQSHGTFSGTLTDDPQTGYPLTRLPVSALIDRRFFGDQVQDC